MRKTKSLSKKITVIAVALLMIFSVALLGACDITNNDLQAQADSLTQQVNTINGESDPCMDEVSRLLQQVIELQTLVKELEAENTALLEQLKQLRGKLEYMKNGYQAYTVPLLESNRCCEPITKTETYWENFAKSLLAFEEAMTYFTTTDDGRTDDFGGFFVDANGIHNILVVGTLEPVKSDYLIYRQVSNSYNFLQSVFEKVGTFVQELSIWKVAICHSCNRVLICVENASDIPSIREMLQTSNLFRANSLNFYAGENQISLT